MFDIVAFKLKGFGTVGQLFEFLRVRLLTCDIDECSYFIIIGKRIWKKLK